MEAFHKFLKKGSLSLGSAVKGYQCDSKARSDDTFGKDSVRLFVYRDHDLKGRKLLFDSKSFSRLGDSQKGGNCRRKSKDGSCSADSNTGKPPTDLKLKDSSESTMVAEMMFGSVAMAYKGPTLKVHTIRSPPKVMITKIFVPVQQLGKETSAPEGEFDSCSYQSGSSSVVTADVGSSLASGPCSAPAVSAHTVPVAVPIAQPPHSLDILHAADTGDSGIVDSGPSSLSSHTTPFPSPSSSSTSSSSYIHRFRRNRNTSLEIHIKSKLSDGSHEKPLPASKRPPQIGIGIVFIMPEGQEEKTQHFQNFVFSHITLIEGHFNKLGLAIEKSLKSKQHFPNSTFEALDQFTESVFNLYLGPRLKEPVWLSMMTSTTKKAELCSHFLREFMSLVEKHNQKHKFVSCLVTAVLTQHLAWVPTVAPAGGTPSRTYLDKHSAKWLDTLAKSHPYNPLWAQLSDLYGAIGFPLKLSRTVVVGRRQDVIRRFLYVLSYFIRCSEVFEAVEEPDQCHLDKLEAAACTQEISIPAPPRDSKEGSLKSSASLFMHGSTVSCSNCGSVIENRAANSPNIDYISTHYKRNNTKRSLRSPPPLQKDDNYFEFGQKRTLKSPPAVFEENLHDLTSNPQPNLEFPVFDLEKPKSLILPAESDSTDKSQPLQKTHPHDSSSENRTDSSQATEIASDDISRNGLLNSDVSKSVDYLQGSAGSACARLEGPEPSQSSSLVEEKSVDVGECCSGSECDGGKAVGGRPRCALLFTLVEGDEESPPHRDRVPPHSNNIHTHTHRELSDNIPDKSLHSHDNSTPLVFTNDSHSNPGISLDSHEIIMPSVFTNDSLSNIGESQDYHENITPSVFTNDSTEAEVTAATTSSTDTGHSVTRSFSENATASSASSLLNQPKQVPRHHSDSTLLLSNMPQQQSLNINGKLHYTVVNNLYPDLTSLKKEEGLESPPTGVQSVVFPSAVSTVTSVAKQCLKGDNVDNTCVLHRVKLGESRLDKTHMNGESVPSGHQQCNVLPKEEPERQLKVQVERHLGKQTVDSSFHCEAKVQSTGKSMSTWRDSGLEDSCEGSTNTGKTLCLDSGVYDDIVFNSENETNSSISTSKKSLGLHSKTNLVIRSFSSDSQNTFSEYESVRVPEMDELDSVINGMQKGLTSVPEGVVSEGNGTQFDHDFEKTLEVPLFGQGSDEALSDQNTISESMDDKRALSEQSDQSMESHDNTNACKDLPQEVDKSVLFDRISHRPATEPCEDLTLSMGSDELDPTALYRTMAWEDGSRRSVYDDMCSSVTDSDITDLEGSLCSECTIKADKSSRQRRHAYKRQGSIPSTGTPGRTSTPGRTRSVTPTELSRRRHASAVSGGGQEQLECMDQTPTAASMEHLAMPRFVSSEGSVVPVERNFGHSLLAGFSPHYLSDFTLHGTSDQHLHTRLHHDLSLAVQNSVLDESITEAACVVADTDKWNVKVMSCHCSNSDRMKTQEVAPSKIISDIIDSVYHLWKLKMSPEFCLMHLEDRLQEVYFKSKMLSEYLRFHRKIDLKELAAMLGFDPTDLPLLLAVAGTHTPYFALGLLP